MTAAAANENSTPSIHEMTHTIKHANPKLTATIATSMNVVTVAIKIFLTQPSISVSPFFSQVLILRFSGTYSFGWYILQIVSLEL